MSQGTEVPFNGVSSHLHRNPCTQRMSVNHTSAATREDGTRIIPSVIHKIGGGFASERHEEMTRADQAALYKSAHTATLPFSWLVADDDSDGPLEEGRDGRDIPGGPGSFLAKLAQETPAVPAREPGEELLIKSVAGDLRLSAVATWLRKRLAAGDTLETLIRYARDGEETLARKMNSEQAIREAFSELSKAQRAMA